MARQDRLAQRGNTGGARLTGLLDEFLLAPGRSRTVAVAAAGWNNINIIGTVLRDKCCVSEAPFAPFSFSSLLFEDG